MEYRTLGSTGIRVSAIAFGAGPVSQLLVGQPSPTQRETVRRAIELGVNWFDTAATYGNGQSEENLGRVLSDLGAHEQVHVATKVRLMPNQLRAIGAHVRESVLASLRRLRLERIALLQLHNSITAEAGAQPTSLTPAHVLAAGGVLDEFQRLKQQGLVTNLGLTGLGEPAALAQVIDSGAFDTLQIPYNLLNPSAGQKVAADFSEPDYGNLVSICAERGMGVFAIRVLAGGALAGNPPSPHTLKTPFFPLELYERDVQRADAIAAQLPAGLSREEAAIRFALSHPAVSSAIIGFATPEQVSQAARFAAAGSLDPMCLGRIGEAAPFLSPGGA
jgi:L-galactose dehydrogenase/L-glyceraldehyde 3-phosphate reductase